MKKKIIMALICLGIASTFGTCTSKTADQAAKNMEKYDDAVDSAREGVEKTEEEKQNTEDAVNQIDASDLGLN